MVDFLVQREIDVLLCVGGDGTQRGSHEIAEEIARRQLPIAVVGVPKTIDNDIQFVRQTFGYYTAIESARAILDGKVQIDYDRNQGASNPSVLLDFLREAELDRVGCFTYSPVDGAAANALPDPVPEEVKEDRKARLMELQAEISARRLATRVGQTMTVLVDEIDEEGAVCRSYADAPEIDGLVFVADSDGLQVGDWVTVRIVESDEYDLWGERLEA